MSTPLLCTYCKTYSIVDALDNYSPEEPLLAAVHGIIDTKNSENSELMKPISCYQKNIISRTYLSIRQDPLAWLMHRKEYYTNVKKHKLSYIIRISCSELVLVIMW